MRIEQIDQQIDQLKSDILLDALQVPEDLVAQIPLEAPPKPEMGERGFPCFALARHFKKAPPLIAEEIAQAINERLNAAPDTPLARLIGEVRPVGPYVNFSFSRPELSRIVLGQALDDPRFGADTAAEPEHWMVEYSAPNTNKPQHLGHVRNDLLGYSVAQIAAWAGHKLTRVNLINDRGIHICKSMLAYQLWGNGETPAETGQKGDHLVGDYYVRFNQELKKEYARWQKTEPAEARFSKWRAETPGLEKLKLDEAGLRQKFFADFSDAYFNQESDLGAQARQMLRQWEAGDPEVVALWTEMNSWVFEGFDETYARLGVQFDEVYYESNTYKLGKEVVLQALKAGQLEQLDDGAIVCDLAKVGMSGQMQTQKVLLRGDGTSVYTTQDIGTAFQRFDAFDLDQMIYVVGNEQDYHFQVLFNILAMLRPELKGRLYHLSYGMVELPEGKMKSREGTVVDADELMDQMEALAQEAVQERWPELDEDALKERARVIGMAALKYFILDFNPRTTVSFDPKKSIDFQGRTGPYCLYSYARIQSLGRRMGGWPQQDAAARAASLAALKSDLELALIRELQEWPQIAARAAAELDPSKITEHLFRLGKSFSTLYNDPDHRIVDLDDQRRRDGLLYLANAVARTLKVGLSLLGIETLEEM